MDAKDVILKIISKRTAQDPINQFELTEVLNRHGFQMSERQARQLISDMRKEGVLILSVSKEGGGYWLAQSREEYMEFRHVKFNAQILDMLETLKTMDSAADKQFNGLQMGLF